MVTVFNRRNKRMQNDRNKKVVDRLLRLLDVIVTCPLPKGYKLVVQGLRNAIWVHRILRSRKLT